MSFFTDKSGFTHRASFYGVRCYLRFGEDGEPTIAGTNLIFDWLLTAAGIFHNEVVERVVQLLACIFEFDYEPGFAFTVWEMESDEPAGE